MTDKLNARALDDLARERVPASTDIWPGIREGIAARQRRRRGSAPKVGRLSIGFAGTLLALLAVVAIFQLNRPEPVSAEAILTRVQADSATSYHLRTVSRSEILPHLSTTQDVWRDGHRERRSIEVRDSRLGTATTIDEVVVEGSEGWSAVSDGDRLKIVRTTGESARGLDSWTQPSSLDEFLAMYNNDRGCLEARLDGEGVVAGRQAYILRVELNQSKCQAIAIHLANEVEAKRTPVPQAEQTPEEKAADERAALEKAEAEPPAQPQTTAEPVEKVAPPPAVTVDSANAHEDALKLKAAKLFGSMLIWVDKSTYLALRTKTLSVTGLVIDDTVATLVEYDVALPDSLFTYTPPDGVEVIDYFEKGR